MGVEVSSRTILETPAYRLALDAYRLAFRPVLYCLFLVSLIGTSRPLGG